MESMETLIPTKYDLCANCKHYYFLHENNFKDECYACDSPEIPLDEKCPGFKSLKNK